MQIYKLDCCQAIESRKYHTRSSPLIPVCKLDSLACLQIIKKSSLKKQERNARVKVSVNAKEKLQVHRSSVVHFRVAPF